MYGVAQVDSSRFKHLPDDFIFSQSSLQAFVDCKRRFWLTYLSRVPWPSVQASPVTEFEQMMRLGAAFHRMVQRAEEGISGEAFPSGMVFPLESWFRAYQEHRPADLPRAYLEVERTLEATIDAGTASQRLMAKYDLIAVDEDGRTVIMDWKTGSRLPRPATLQQKMQTSVYPYVLVEASASLPWGPVSPEQVEMRYWFVAAPDQPVVFRYDAAQHASNRDRIVGLVQEILGSRDESDYPKVADTFRTRKYVCGFCKYRGLCDRGDSASDVVELDDFAPEDSEEVNAYLDFSLDDVDAIPY